MKVKLSHKLFAAFLCTSSLTVVAMVVITQTFATRNFTDYVNRVEMEKLSNLMNEFKDEYIRHRGWDTLRDDDELWWDILRSKNVHGDLDLPFSAPPPPPPHGEEEFRRQGHHLFMPPRGPQEKETPPFPPQPHDPFRMPFRISLFDEAMRLVAGNVSPPQEQILKPIEVDGKTVGWLGIRKRTQLSQPLEMEFEREQTRVFFLTGLVALGLAGLLSLVFSGHLVRPIRKLIEGTRALSRREFETRVVIASHDELGQLASDFNNLAQTLDRYERMRKQWLSDISHELRTPLSILRAEIEAMQDGVREITLDGLASLHAEILYLAKIVNDLHDLSLADSAMLAVKTGPVSVIRVLRSTLRSFETRFKDRDMQVEDAMTSEPDFVLAGDENRLKQLFSNILENTLRYADSPGTLKIWHDHTGDELILNFMDSGPGVPEESLERLFDRLYRVDQARNRGHGGSGLGLAICKGIIEALGGKIKAANGAGAGLWITIVMPLASTKTLVTRENP
jgi:two-component system, OmpR family, sensor histidine kinase BaeS